MRAWFLVVMCAAACDGGGESCDTEASFQCDGDMLQVCTNGEYVDVEDCADSEMMCHADMGHCM